MSIDHMLRAKVTELEKLVSGNMVSLKSAFDLITIQGDRIRELEDKPKYLLKPRVLKKKK